MASIFHLGTNYNYNLYLFHFSLDEITSGSVFIKSGPAEKKIFRLMLCKIVNKKSWAEFSLSEFSINIFFWAISLSRYSVIVSRILVRCLGVLYWRVKPFHLILHFDFDLRNQRDLQGDPTLAYEVSDSNTKLFKVIKNHIIVS